MKRICVLVLALALTGCGVELLTTTAIQGQLQAENAKAATRVLEHVGSQTAKINIKRAIDTYRAEEGVNPPSLEALVPKWLPRLPIKSDGTPYYYDPVMAEVLDEAPAAPFQQPITADDREFKVGIQRAIVQYGRAMGHYPANLETLVQNNLIPYVPLTSSGQSFIYNPQDGSLFHPAELAAQNTAPGRSRSVQRRGAPMGGAGPLGETMTGIGIQRQLGNMNNSGTSAAGSAARRGVSGVTNRHNQRQSQALRDLDL